MMKHKSRLILDPETLVFNPVRRSSKALFKKIMSGLGLSMAVGGLFTFLFFSFTSSPKEKSLDRKTNEYALRIQLLNNKVDKVISILDQLQANDDRTYRTIFEMSPLANEIRQAGVGGSDQYTQFDIVSNGEILKNASKKLDMVSRRILIQSKSFSDIKSLIIDKEKMLASIPSIMPVDVRRIKFSSGFGWRRNPFTGGGSQYHPGIDLAGKIGTPIYASGDGVVYDPYAKSGMHGYGQVVCIDHGYGFKTLYAHLSKILVKPGEKVKRGQVIGLLGNTGPSTGPHLHYEVIKNGNKVNPINYIYNGFSPDEFKEILKKAEAGNEILS